MFGKALLRTALHACKQDSNIAGTRLVLPALVNAGDRRQSASSAASSTAAVLNEKTETKQKTMEDLDGPSFLTSLYWLFGKGYFQTTHQMQVR